MAVNSDYARLFGSDADAVWVGPTTATFPTTLDGTLTGFEEVGWLNTDTGVTETLMGSVTEIRGHQGGTIVRTRVENSGTQFSFVALEDKALTNGLRYDQVSSTTATGTRTSVHRPGQKVQRRKVVIDLFDQDTSRTVQKRVLATVDIVPNGDRTFVNSDIAAYPFLATVIGNYTVIETDVDYVAP